jgi:hypothetical protein
MKQIPANSGFYITLSDASAKSYVNNGTMAAPLMVAITTTNLGVASLTAASAVNAVLRDEGVTLRSASRVFRKVQLMSATGSVLDGVNGTDGVGGAAGSATVTGPYLTYYIELPGNPSSGTSSVTPVARLG